MLNAQSAVIVCYSRARFPRCFISGSSSLKRNVKNNAYLISKNSGGVTTQNTDILSITVVIKYLLVIKYKNTPRFAASYGTVRYRTVRRTPKPEILKMFGNP